MRFLLLLLAVGCVASRPDPVSDVRAEAPEVRPISDFGTEPRVTVWPQVELVPVNGLEFTVEAPEAIDLSAQDFTIYRVKGDQAEAVEDALQRWTWSGDRRVATLRPQGLQKGAPYLLVGELATESGEALATFGHPFRIVGEDTTAPSARGLRVRGTTTPGSREPLTLVFADPVKHDVVHKVSALSGPTPWPGAWTLAADQRTLTFTPSEPWDASGVVVTVMAGIRDLGGNEIVDRPEGFLTPVP